MERPAYTPGEEPRVLFILGFSSQSTARETKGSACKDCPLQGTFQICSTPQKRQGFFVATVRNPWVQSNRGNTLSNLLPEDVRAQEHHEGRASASPTAKWARAQARCLEQ
jgi:hypothetical protein